MKVIIIGGGAAGLSAATRLRRLNENVEIVIFEKSDELGTATCGLTYYLSGEVTRAELSGPTPEFMKQRYNIDVRLNSEIDTVDRENKTVTILNRPPEYYDKLIITVGGLQLRPDIEGVLGDNIFTINDLASIERIKDYIQDMSPARALIVGGGAVGIEAAEALNLLKIEVSIVEASSHVLSMLDYDMAATLHNHLREKGINLYLNQKVISFGETKATLSNGRTLDYDMAIVATGVSPEIKIPVMADLKVGKRGGLIVNKFMQTSDKDIYAAGDVIEIPSQVCNEKMRLPQAGLAVKEARIAAEHISGLKSEFEGALGATACKVCKYTAAAVGCNEKTLIENNIAYHKFNMYDYSHASYFPGAELMLFKLLFAPDGRLLGAQGIGRDGIDKRIDILSAYMSRNSKVSALTAAEICYAPPYSSGKDAINNLGSMAESLNDGQVKFAFFDEIDWSNQTGETMLIDVRSPEQFKDGHLPNAINIPLEAIRKNLDSIPHEKKVILYCNFGYGAYNAACILANRGFDNIYMLSGSMHLYEEITEDQNHSAADKNFGEIVK